MNRSVTWALAVAAGVVLLSRRASAQAPADSSDNTDMGSNRAFGIGIRAMAMAIAHAEGFFVPGSIPARANNPGDLVIPGWRGGSLGEQNISVFPSAAAGWQRLYSQLQLIADGRSHVYTPDMTIADVGSKWTATQASAWVNNVVTYLQGHGYDAAAEDTPIGDVLYD